MCQFAIIFIQFEGLTRADRVTASCHPSDLPNIEAFKVKPNKTKRKLLETNHQFSFLFRFSR